MNDRFVVRYHGSCRFCAGVRNIRGTDPVRTCAAGPTLAVGRIHLHTPHEGKPNTRRHVWVDCSFIPRPRLAPQEAVAEVHYRGRSGLNELRLLPLVGECLGSFGCSHCFDLRAGETCAQQDVLARCKSTALHGSRALKLRPQFVAVSLACLAAEAWWRRRDRRLGRTQVPRGVVC